MSLYEVADRDEVPGWFWDVLAATAPSVAALAAWLEGQPKETVERFGYVYETASLKSADYWDGIEVDGVGRSEDDMEDLCHWIVRQSRVY